MTRTSVLRGPAAISYGGTTFYTEGDITVDITIEVNPVNTSMFGKVDDTASSIKIDVTATPIGIWGAAGATFAATSALLWPWLGAASVPGASIFPATAAAEVPLFINTLSDGAVYELKSAAITKMPSLKLSTQNILCGAVTWSGLRCLAASTNIVQAWSVASSLLETLAPHAFPDDTVGRVFTLFSTAYVLRDAYSVIWTGVTPLTAATETLDGVSIDFGMETKPESCDSLGVYDYTLTGISATAKFTPIGNAACTIDALLTAMKIQGTGGARGMSMAAQAAAALVITGAATKHVLVTLNNAALLSAPMGFGADRKRIGELTFSANRTFTSGATGALATIAPVLA